LHDPQVSEVGNLTWREMALQLSLDSRKMTVMIYILAEALQKIFRTDSAFDNFAPVEYFRNSHETS